jgi:hypothetical protein
MNTMNFYPEFSLTASDLTNGAINTYKVEFVSKVFMVEGDILNLHFPPTVLLTDQVKCLTPQQNSSTPLKFKQLISEISCNGNRQTLQVIFNKLVEKTGKYEFYIEGI